MSHPRIPGWLQGGRYKSFCSWGRGGSGRTASPSPQHRPHGGEPTTQQPTRPAPHQPWAGGGCLLVFLIFTKTPSAKWTSEKHPHPHLPASYVQPRSVRVYLQSCQNRDPAADLPGPGGEARRRHDLPALNAEPEPEPGPPGLREHSRSAHGAQGWETGAGRGQPGQPGAPGGPIVALPTRRRQQRGAESRQHTCTLTPDPSPLSPGSKTPRERAGPPGQAAT